MGVRAQAVLVASVDLVAGVVGGWLIYAETLPLRPESPGEGLTPDGVVQIVLVGALVGLVVGAVQAWFAGWMELWLGLIGGLLLGLLPVWWFVILMANFTRVMPVPDGGAPIDPSPAELATGLLFWTGFVLAVVAVVAVVQPRLRRRRIAHLQRAARLPDPTSATL